MAMRFHTVSDEDFHANTKKASQFGPWVFVLRTKYFSFSYLLKIHESVIQHC